MGKSKKSGTAKRSREDRGKEGYGEIVVGTEEDRPIAVPPSFLAQRWDVRQQGDILEVGYGKGGDFPQYAALHLNDSYFRLNYGPSCGWGTSIILLPVLWEKGKSGPTQGSQISVDQCKVESTDFLLFFTGSIASLRVQGQLRLRPPKSNSISVLVKLSLDGKVTLDHHRTCEMFKPVMLSSMHVHVDKWDAKSAFVDRHSLSVPQGKWIIQPHTTGRTFGLRGGTSRWQTYGPAPTIQIALDEPMMITGWVTPSDDPNDDNVGFWAATDRMLRSWQYRITAKP